MTKCGRNEGNRKSTAYNQTGQSYYEQLSAYNSMCTHLRRLLLAKGVVDTGTKTSATKMTTQWNRRSTSKPRFTRVDLSDSTIDRLALGSYHRPLMFQKNSEYDSKQDPRSWKYCIECYNNYNSRYPELKAFAQYAGLEENHNRTAAQTHSRATSSSSAKRTTPRPSRPTRISRASSAVRTKQRNPLLEINIRTGGTKFVDGKGHSKGGYTFFHRGFEDESFQSDSSLDIVTHPETRFSVLSALTKKHEECQLNKRNEKIIRSKAGCAKDEREMYAKFVFDITRDIMENGLYTDAQLHQVFTKHIKQNKTKLNMRKMLAEIYQLKVSLNMFDDSELDEELECFLHNSNKKYMNPLDIRESDPMEKHLVYHTLPEPRLKSASGGKSVVLVDANPELLITERDVLLSLMEADIEPKVAEKICKSLYCRSRSVSAVGSDQLDPESITQQAEELQSLASHNLSEGSTKSYKIETSEIRSKENKVTQIDWQI